jgi:acetolactate synthase-1/2/3 large subunit
MGDDTSRETTDASGDDGDGPRSRTYTTPDVTGQEWGSDLIADVLKAYGWEYVPFNPGASFRGIEESIVNYNDNQPTVIETPHEGLSVSIAHGHAKATGDPAVCILHDVVGTLHGAMSLYNAYVDRVPIVTLSGTGPLRKSRRRPWIEWIHTAINQGELVREYTKWDDQPTAIDGVVESLTRAHRLADTRPKGPTYVTFDHDIQEGELDEPVELPDLERLGPPTRMAPDPDAIEAAADRLVAAETPVIIADQVGDSRRAVDALVDLSAELGAAVIDPRKRRFNLPNTHPMDLSGTEIHREADLVLALDVWSLDYTLTDTDNTDYTSTEAIDPDTEIVEIGTRELGVSSLIADYYDQRETELSIMADTALAVPALRDAVRDRLDANDAARARAEERSESFAERHDRQRAQWESEAADAWDETPVSVPRLAGEVWDLIEDESWVLVNGTLREWTHRLWEIDEYDSYVGGRSGGAGVGYGIGAAIGAALAYEDSDRVPINLQADGDLMFYPNALWTMGHYEIPMLTVIHNNRSLYNSTEHRMNLARYRGRDDSLERAMIGTGYWDPTPDYATMAESMGVAGYGPIEDPDDIAPALQSAWADVQAGRPALVDVVCQPR